MPCEFPVLPGQKGIQADQRCDSTDTVGSKPAGWDVSMISSNTLTDQLVDDSIFVAAMTTSAATVTVKSGNKQSTQYVSSAGIHTLTFPMNTGPVTFDITTADGRVGSARGAVEIGSECYVSDQSIMRLETLTATERRLQLQHTYRNCQS